MRKPSYRRWLMGGTALCVLLMILCRPREHPVSARFATVERADVHRVIALSGRLAYDGKQYVYAQSSGTVSQVYVKSGQRVGAGEALIRLDSAAQDQLASVWAASAGALSEAVSMPDGVMTTSVIRAQQPCTVRQVFIVRNMPVTAGTPVAEVSSNEQIIVCQVSGPEEEAVICGMWAWISAAGEELGTAAVEAVGDSEVDPTTGIPFTAVTLRPARHVDLPEGAAIDVDIFLAGSDDVLSLPLEAVTERDTVWWVTEGRCTEIPAQIVMADEMRAWVNLPEGITVAIGEFQEGQRVVEADE